MRRSQSSTTLATSTARAVLLVLATALGLTVAQTGSVAAQSVRASTAEPATEAAEPGSEFGAVGRFFSRVFRDDDETDEPQAEAVPRYVAPGSAPPPRLRPSRPLPPSSEDALAGLGGAQTEAAAATETAEQPAAVARPDEAPGEAILGESILGEASAERRALVPSPPLLTATAPRAKDTIDPLDALLGPEPPSDEIGEDEARILAASLDTVLQRSGAAAVGSAGASAAGEGGLWSDPTFRIIGAFALGVILLAAAVLREWTGSRPSELE